MAFSSSPYIEFEPEALVKQFSWEVEARQRTETDTEAYNQLSSDLISERERRDRERQQKIHLIEEHFRNTRSDDAIIFDKAKRQLLEAMERFQKLVPSHLKTNELPTSWDEVSSAVTEVQTQWDSKTKDGRVGRAKQWVRKMCNGMNNHSAALKMLPSESEYVSIIGGSVTMIIKASANYTNISESFTQGVVEINDAVHLDHLSHVYDTPELQQLTMRLYTHIFSYLIRFMTWYTDNSTKRFLRSFNESIHLIFEEDLAQVKKISGIISRQIQSHMSAEVKISRLLLEDVSSDLRYLLQFAEIDHRLAHIRDAANAKTFEHVFRLYMEKSQEDFKNSFEVLARGLREELRSSISGVGITNLLQQQASHQIEQTTVFSVPHRQNNSGVDTMLDQGVGDDPEAVSHEDDIRQDSSHFEDYFTWDHIHPTESTLPLLADATFVAKLNDFTTVMESRVLYACGQHQPSSTCLLRQSASKYISLARDAHVPVISFFCELSHEEPPEHRTRESVALSSLLYAMIRQLINLLPPDAVSTTAIPAASCLNTLDGTLRTWKDAVHLFEQLVGAVRLQLLLFVIDGINVLEEEPGSNTNKALDSLISCLTSLAKAPSGDEDRIVKILFTTSGQSEILCQLVDEDDISFCDNSDRGRRARPRHARQTLSY